jgi:hypothetical protein
LRIAFHIRDKIEHVVCAVGNRPDRVEGGNFRLSLELGVCSRPRRP